MFKRVLRRFLLRGRSIQAIQFLTIDLLSILIVFTHLLLSLPSALFPFIFPTTYHVQETISSQFFPDVLPIIFSWTWLSSLYLTNSTTCEVLQCAAFSILLSLHSYSVQIISSASSSQPPHPMENVIFWDMSPCGSCRNLRFRGTYRLYLQVESNQRTKNMLVIGSEYITRHLWDDCIQNVESSVGHNFIGLHGVLQG
jgi:hypothetical protein